MGFAFLVVVVGGAVGLMRWLRHRDGAAPTLSTGSMTVPAQSSREAMEQAIADRRRRDAA